MTFRMLTKREEHYTVEVIYLYTNLQFYDAMKCNTSFGNWYYFIKMGALVRT